MQHIGRAKRHMSDSIPLAAIIPSRGWDFAPITSRAQSTSFPFDRPSSSEGFSEAFGRFFWFKGMVRSGSAHDSRRFPKEAHIDV